ncbi:fatty acyl-CoA reductase wat-like [Epargyreus clarus]|uniref:fatty acyl-CoA reductase wat-like n=1 Tax=Epargyreus clarus TaxID=520877 RepID=UPI003C3053B7
MVLEKMGFLEDRDLSNVPTIPEFYKGKSIFITGGTGFMGKVLIEKLLYSCTDLDKIYLLIRTKKGVNAEDRLKNIYLSPCFDRLRKERPGVFESKVSVMDGDASQVGLGLTKEDRELIIKKVNIVFHTAASVRFDDSLRFAANLNIRSAVEIVEIAKEMENLDVLVHVSTSYSNARWNPIEEAMYPAYADWRETLKICEELDEDALRALTPKYLGSVPNTYIFTKQLAEHVIYEQKGKLPIIIIRPSVVVSSVSEPVPGWIENFNGPIAIILGIGTGVLRCIYTTDDFATDYVPVDESIRHFIAAAWIRGTKKFEPTDDIVIYNCCSNKKVTNAQLLSYGQKYCWDIPFKNSIWTIGLTMTRNKYYYYIKVFFNHLLPALFVDMLLWLMGKPTMLFRLQRRVFISNIALQKFMSREWLFVVDNFNRLRDCLKEDDYRDFYYDFKKLGTEEHFVDSLWGSRRYLLKEKDENIPQARIRIRAVYALDVIIRLALYGFIFWKIITSHYVVNWYQSLL